MHSPWWTDRVWLGLCANPPASESPGAKLHLGRPAARFPLLLHQQCEGGASGHAGLNAPEGPLGKGSRAPTKAPVPIAWNERAVNILTSSSLHGPSKGGAVQADVDLKTGPAAGLGKVLLYPLDLRRATALGWSTRLPP